MFFSGYLILWFDTLTRNMAYEIRQCRIQSLFSFVYVFAGGSLQYHNIDCIWLGAGLELSDKPI